MGVFDFFRRKQAVVEPIVEQDVLVNETNEEKQTKKCRVL